jgi:lipid kinase YegS
MPTEGATQVPEHPLPTADHAAAPLGRPRSIRLVLNLTGANDDRLREAVGRLRAAGHTVDVRVAWDPLDVVLFAREAAEAGYDVVAAGGGDGTVNAVARGLLSEDVSGPACRTALGIVPFGTANDLATACGLDSADPAPVLDLLAHGRPRPIDIGRMNGVPFLNVASGGYAAEVTTETDPAIKKLLGGLAYWVTGLTSLGRLEPRLIRLSAGDFRWEGRVYAVAVCNGRQAGGGLRLAPRALLDDGLLDVAIVPEVPWTEFLTAYADLQRIEQENRSQHIIYGQASHILIDAPDGLQVNLDGEPLRGDRFEFTIEPRRLCCLLPEACAPLLPDPNRPVASPP